MMMMDESDSAPTPAVAAAATAAAPQQQEMPNRRPMNAFLLFCKRHRTLVKEIYPNLENRNITKILGEWWSNLTPEEKEPFNSLASTYKEHLLKEQPGGLRWRKQSQQPQQQQPPPPPPPLQRPAEVGTATGEMDNHKTSRGSSSSPEPSPQSSGSNSSSNSTCGGATSAPKPFKKRYLAAEKAKLGGSSSSSSPSAASETKNACEALLQLAEGAREASSPSTSAPQSGGCSPKSEEPGHKTTPYGNVKAGAGFDVLRDAVWSRVAKTLLTQDKEKDSDANNGDTPINLSIQCSIRGQTIIEHIIENILDDDSDKTGNDQGLNNNSGGSGESGAKAANGGADDTTEQIKERIYQSLKDDMMRRANSGIKDNSDRSALWSRLPDPAGRQNGSKAKPKAEEKTTPVPPKAGSPKQTAAAVVASPKQAAVSPKQAAPGSAGPAVSVTLVTRSSSNAEDLPLNLSTTPPQTPAAARTAADHMAAVTITTSPAKRKLLDDDDDDIRRSSRACKGRRYQEFKDAVGRKGRKAGGRSDDQHSEEEQLPSPVPRNTSSSNTQKWPDSSSPTKQPEMIKFDLERALTAIPALRPEEFQKRVQVSRQLSKSPGGGAQGGAASAESAAASGFQASRRNKATSKRISGGKDEIVVPTS